MPCEVHTDKYTGTKRANVNLKYAMYRRVHFSDGEYIIPVEMHIKEFSNRDQNKLYVSLRMKTTVLCLRAAETTNFRAEKETDGNEI